MVWQWKGPDYDKFKHIMESPRESEENLERLVAKGLTLPCYLGSYLASLSLGILV